MPSRIAYFQSFLNQFLYRLLFWPPDGAPKRPKSRTFLHTSVTAVYSAAQKKKRREGAPVQTDPPRRCAMTEKGATSITLADDQRRRGGRK